MLNIISLAIGIVLFTFLWWGALTSLKEKEWKAAWVFSFLGCLLPIPFVLFTFVTFPGTVILQWSIIGAVLLSLIIILIPIRISDSSSRLIPKEGEDERDTMFSRRELIQGTDQYSEYYRRKPEYKEGDDTFRKNPGLLKSGSKFFNPVAFAAADASFKTVDHLHTLVSGEKQLTKVPLDEKSITRFIKKWGKKLGAIEVGITPCKDYHFYTVGGRRERYGTAVKNQHKYAITFTVEMDFTMMSTAPAAPTVMESAQQYLSSGTIAVQVAELIRNLGYSARAHIDANYELICPTLARDAGLGEIGRMGLLMTPRHGPRVRVSAVTTDMPLMVDKPTHDISILDFCNRCRKCAEVCPAKAIPFDDRKQIDGIIRWKLDSEACYTYWTKAGTDCGRCVTVCPFSHPDNVFHLLIRKGIKNSVIFSRLALPLDNLFYGKKPRPQQIPKWIPHCPEEQPPTS